MADGCTIRPGQRHSINQRRRFDATTGGAWWQSGGIWFGFTSLEAQYSEDLQLNRVHGWCAPGFMQNQRVTEAESKQHSEARQKTNNPK